MKTTATKQPRHQYGIEVIEFFPFAQDELDTLLGEAGQDYLTGVESPHHGRTAANVPFIAEPLQVALPKLHEKQMEGYTIRQDRYCGILGTSLNVTLRKPEKTIAAELAGVHEWITDKYESNRYSRNKAETERQIQITLDRNAREAEQAAAEAQAIIDAELAAAKAVERQAALADLLKAYTE